MKRIFILLLLGLAGLCYAQETDVAVTKISETEVKVTTTTGQVVKVKDLVDKERRTLQLKTQLEKEYAAKEKQINAVLLDIQDKIRKAEEAGVEIPI